MGGANRIESEVHPKYFGKSLLHERTIFPYDACIVAIHLCVVHLQRELVVEHVRIEGAKSTKGICREEYSFGSIVRKHYLRPVYHGCHNEGEVVVASRQRVSVIYGDEVCFQVWVIGLKHIKSLFVAD